MRSRNRRMKCEMGKCSVERLGTKVEETMSAVSLVCTV